MATGVRTATNTAQPIPIPMHITVTSMTINMTTISPVPTKPLPDASRMSRTSQILHAWFSPGYPVGGYSYSHGLEWAVESGAVHDPGSLQDWLADLIEYGAGHNDAVLLTEAWRATNPHAAAELAEALSPSKERHLETMAQGAAFSRTTSAVWEIDLPPFPYPVAIGRAARLLDIDIDQVLTLFVQSFAANIVSAGVRLIPIGQTDGQRITYALMPLCADMARSARNANIDDLGGVTTLADSASMLHETQYTRLYRS
jgi:urease accessory protein